jgi:hypothetical protein
MTPQQKLENIKHVMTTVMYDLLAGHISVATYNRAAKRLSRQLEVIRCTARGEVLTRAQEAYVSLQDFSETVPCGATCQCCNEAVDPEDLYLSHPNPEELRLKFFPQASQAEDQP